MTRLLSKKQICMEGGYMLDRINWGMIGIIIMNTFIWYSIFTNGFMITLIWLIIVGAVVGISINVRDWRI